MGDVVQMQVTTVCTECRHLESRGSIWYDHFCKAEYLSLAIDPYDGITKRYGTNDFGNRVFTENDFEYCRNVNDGNCSKFEGIK